MVYQTYIHLCKLGIMKLAKLFHYRKTVGIQNKWGCLKNMKPH